MNPIPRQHTLQMLRRSLQNGKAAHERDTPAREAQCKLLRSHGNQRNAHEESQREEYRREEEADAEYLEALLVVHAHDFLGELGFEGGAHGGYADVYVSHEGLGFDVVAAWVSIVVVGGVGGAAEEGAEAERVTHAAA